ncbi:glutamate synthase-related protein [Actinomarinicola tropica]|uniref:Glutamate synthase subunit alpha n=1 Tax=Actinomarinicola tropica TaxID=2789776 RepID=A0A5Q2RJM4_9ACTN|nr:glutamate synthase-related protein [Actinomarinicola tropica]QGG95102.1 glutamate synthase subunit alpha [Actinomarinicola tropica]
MHAPTPDRELDACGIGFVADAQGRTSRAIVEKALDGLANVKHRGAVAADARSGDGAGLLAPIPPAIFGEGNGVVVLFVRGADPREATRGALADEGLELLEWRVPPTDDEHLGELALKSKPEILQAIVRGPEGADADDLERRAFRARRAIGATVEGVYVASCSFRTIVYKGLTAADELGRFYLDLADERFEAPFAIFHQRFSTNTLPTWERAQPFRMLCHNGEINALWGNENRMAARATLGTEDAGLGAEDDFRPVLDPTGSDSSKLDEALELLTRGGRRVDHSMAMLIPDAWESARDLSVEVQGFFRYHSALMEPWDGPAGVVFTDGLRVGALLDRNGLRPLRWQICEDGLVVCSSEVGAVDISGHGKVRRGRLGPGQMLVVDPADGGVHTDADIKQRLADQAPYGRWAADGFHRLGTGEPALTPPDDLVERQVAHGYTKEELAMVLKPMANDAYEPTFAMGDDTPLPPFASKARPLHHFFRQRFAQVTNPPIDPIRERDVMSLRTLLGPRSPILIEGPRATRLLTIPSFFMFPSAVEQLHDPSRCPFPVATIDATFPVADGAEGLRRAVERIADEAAAAVADGAGVVVIDDGAISPDRAAVPSLLSVGAVQHRLTAERLRSLTSLVVLADDVRDVHHVATLVGYGADGICPRLALHTVGAEADADENTDNVSPEAQFNFQAACEAGLLKILSKMGISTIDSYRGAQIFEIVGLAPEVVELCFGGTVSTVGGLGWDALGEDVLARHAAAWPEDGEPDLDSPGLVRDRRGGEYHAHDKAVVEALNELTGTAPKPKKPTSRTRVRSSELTAVEEATDDARAAAADNDVDPSEGQLADMTAAHLLQRAIAGERSDLYDTFAQLVAERPTTELNDLLELVDADPIPLDEVEPATEIARRFSTGAMSHGALSKEAHETLAQAMNLIGGKANCGEGGEDPYRYRTRGMGRDDKNSRIKQVASGRFGVTPEYLAFADEIQIKMAQGSKPGEGGQLPGHKVSAEIARLRHTQEGVGLISPPPHHDIYSIEDLAQLIYDLKQVNAAQVSVKLVSEDGVGTIAAGCVKALADVVHLSGANGGTGASPLSSIKHAGLPWELGLADCQQALVENGLRSRVRLRVDGGFKTGRQVVVAALLGADEYSFGTAAMVAEGCIMLRACHRDTCKPGVATQRPHLRANFTGTPEGVAAYMMFVAEEVRGFLAQLGLRTLDEAIGRVDLLRQRTTGNPRVDSVDLSPLLRPVAEPGDARHFVERVELQDPRSELGDQLLADAFRAIWDGDDIELSYDITNADRSIGAALAGAVGLEFGATPPRGTAAVSLRGSAGQSFGAFLGHGVTLDLHGEANDYVGKGMGGGRIVVRIPDDDVSHGNGTHVDETPALVGNTCLYGATGGELYVAGAAGERFAVRNSGAVAVVEGVGEHGCEYMTGGTVLVIGRIGFNFGAGMTGGQAFIWDPVVERLTARVNSDLVEIVRPDVVALDEARWMLEQHVELTGSARARDLLESWETTEEQFWHVVPRDRASRIASTMARRVSNA